MSTVTSKPWQVARIREADCIGCTKCIDVCPTDAIVGTAKYMHTVLTQECIGCQLCIPPCPVDCIELDILPVRPYELDRVRSRIQARKNRLAQHADDNHNLTPAQDKKAEIAAAVKRKKS